MAQKRSGPTAPQSRSRKRRAVKKRSQNLSSSPGMESPMLGEGPDQGDDDDDGDGMAYGTQALDTIQKQVTALQERHKARDVWPLEFDKKLEDQERVFLRMLEDMKIKLAGEKSSFEDRLVFIFESATCPVIADEAEEVPAEPVVHVPFPTASDQAFFRDLSSLIRECHALSSTYNDLAGINTPQTSIPQLESDLKMDKAAILNSISASRKLVTRDVEGMLADSFHEVRGRSDMTADDEARGRLLMMRVKEDKDDDDGVVRDAIGFGKTAMALEQAAKKMEAVGRRK